MTLQREPQEFEPENLPSDRELPSPSSLRELLGLFFRISPHSAVVPPIHGSAFLCFSYPIDNSGLKILHGKCQKETIRKFSIALHSE